MFLVDRPLSKTIGGETSYYRTFGKHVDLFFLRTVGTRPQGDRETYLAPTSWHTRSPHHLQLKQQTLSSFASAKLHIAPGTRRRRSLHQGACPFSLGDHPLQRSHLLPQQEGFAPSRAGQLQQSKQTSRDQVHGAPQLDRGRYDHHQPHLDQGPAERHLFFEDFFFGCTGKTLDIFLSLLFE